MHSTAKYTQQSIRFRRWSRVGYAVFSSLACTVTIGALAISISDKSLIKTDKELTHLSVDFSCSESSDSIAEESELLENTLTQTLQFTQTAQDAAAVIGNTHNIILPVQRLKGHTSPFNRFFIYLKTNIYT